MQQDKKELIKEALSKAMKQSRGEQSLFKFCSENDISLSVVSEAERALKDPQLTTVFKLAEAYGLTPAEFVDKISSYLPDGFYMIEK